MRTIACDRCRELLLSAEPDALRASLDEQAATAEADALRDHLRTCSHCASLAAAVLAENAAVNDALVQVTTSRGQGGAPRAAVRKFRLPRWSATLVPLAAAAALLLVWCPQAPGPAGLPPLAGPVEEVPATPVVNAAGARGVAVMRTNDPNITIVWTF